MKKRIVLVILASTFFLTGCSLFNREYSHVTEHSESYYEGNEKSILRAESQQDLVTDILRLMEEYAPEGKIWYYTAMSAQEMEELTASACEEVQKETPLGAYAMDYITYEIERGSSNNFELSLMFSYKKTQNQIDDIIHTNSINALSDLLKAVAEANEKELVLQVTYFNNQTAEVEEIVRTVESEYGFENIWTVTYYPNAEKETIIEIQLGNSRLD